MESIDNQSQNSVLKRLRPDETATATTMQPLNTKADVDQLSSKKARLNDQQRTPPAPSKVIHVRGLPLDVADQEIMSLCVPFGRVTQMVVLRQKQQALVEMQDVASATLLVQYFSANQPTIRGMTVHLQFSNKTMITPNQRPNNINNNNNSNNGNANGQQQQQQQQSSSTGATSTTNTGANASGEPPSRNVLLVTVLNMVYPVTIDILYQIFSKYGSVLRIALIHKNIFQALIQFSSPNEADAAKTALDSQNIYSGCCTLKIQYSQLSTLQIKQNNDRTRDFTNPNLPSPSSHQNQAGGADWMDHNAGAFASQSQPQAQQTQAYGAFPATFQGYDARQVRTAYPAAAASMFANSAAFGRNPMAQVAMMSAMQAGHTVLIVSNLATDKVNPDILFKLFGVYGDVIRVKILYNKPDTALIQFNNPQGCSLALQNLNHCPLFGKNLMVNYSKHQTVQMPKLEEGAEPAKFTRDYTSSPLHRYRVANSKNFQHITSPTNILFVANVPNNATEDQVRDLFARYGTINTFRSHTKDGKRLFWVHFSSVAEAVEALVLLHDHAMFDNGPNLRVSFSKKE